MATAAEILRANGMGLADECIQAADAEGLEHAAAATILQMESGGRNVWGSDPGSTGGAYVKGTVVTKAAYLAYRPLAQAGKIPHQGVGPVQCTSAGYQNTADALGGCWDPVANMRSGYRGLANLIRLHGVRDGARAYNGSGTQAEIYANLFMARYGIWKNRLASATPTPPVGDELSAQFEIDSRARWAREDLLDRDLRSDLAVKQKQIDDLETKVTTILADILAALAAKAA